MRLLPRSLSGRLLVISALTTIVALGFAAVAIGHVLERFVVHGLDQQLDAEVAMLARAIRADATLDPARVADLPAFDGSDRGWGWRVESRRGSWTDGATFGEARPSKLGPKGRGRPGPSDIGPVPGEAWTEMGDPVHTRALLVETPAGEVIVIAAGPRRIAMEPLREAMVPLLVSLAILGVLLVLASLVQLRIGLRPLRILQASVSDVRTGRARSVPCDQPRELAPLAVELNALLDQNEMQLEHARRHVANLAHGLKTPLAALSVQLAEAGHDADSDIGTTLASIDARVRHHLGRARAAAPGSRQHAGTSLATAIEGLVAVMKGVHAERAIVVACELEPELVIAADPQDVDEILGNLLDNAWRHARAALRISAASAGRFVKLVIEDDGPGLSPDASVQALVPGRRLDEAGEGYGFGLPIAQELTELNGGSLTLDKSPLGGLRVALTLPGGH